MRILESGDFSVSEDAERRHIERRRLTYVYLMCIDVTLSRIQELDVSE